MVCSVHLLCFHVSVKCCELACAYIQTMMKPCVRTGLKAAESVQAEDWILYSMTHQAELARVRCGGWRRQYTHTVTSPSRFTFACYRHRDIHIDRRSVDHGSKAPGKSIPSTTGWLHCAMLTLQTTVCKLTLCLTNFHAGRAARSYSLAKVTASNSLQCCISAADNE